MTEAVWQMVIKARMEAFVKHDRAHANRRSVAFLC